MGYFDFMFVSYLLLFVILFIFFFYVCFITYATQPTVKTHACNAVRISNNRCCQNYQEQGTSSIWRACLARMHWEFS